MPIPESEQFNDFLLAVTLQEPEAPARFERHCAVPKRTLTTTNAAHETEPVYIWYPSRETISPASFMKKVAEELGATGHVANRAFVHLLSLLTCLRRAEADPAAVFNELLDAVSWGDASQFAIAAYPPWPGTSPYQIGDFTVGRVNRERLVYRARKVKCDYFERYPNDFINRLGIERAPGKVRVLDWRAVERLVRPHRLVLEIADFYFETASSELRNGFIQDFWETQLMLIATGGPCTPVRDPFWWAGARFVCIFQKIGTDEFGYFCPLGREPILEIDYANASRRVPEKMEQLETEYSFTGFTDSEIHQSLHSYVKIISRAVEDESPRRISEVFLQHVIAIDLLLGEDGSSSESFSLRAAAIYAAIVGTEYEPTCRKLKRLYDKRSRYVHQGEAPRLADLELVVQVASAITECLLRLQAHKANHSPGFIRRWLADLDIVAASMKAGRPVSTANLTNAGLPTVPDTSTPALERLRLAVTGHLLSES